MVFLAQYRRGVFAKEMINELSGIWRAILAGRRADDAPAVALCARVNRLKGVSSRMMCKKQYYRGRAPIRCAIPSGN